MKTTKTTLLVLLVGACAGSGLAQTFDSSGDGKLNGTYYFRQVLYFEQTNDEVSIEGNIIFNGAGSYTLSNATLLDANSGATTPGALTGSGTYSIAASGEGFISALDSADFPNDQILGLVSAKGIFMGSSTENSNGYNDMFIAAPVASPAATNATLSGSYQVAYFDPTFAGDALLSFSANGSGNIGTVNATEYIGSNTATTSQTLTGVTYSFSNGAAQINFGGNNQTNLIGGGELLYISPDGNFIFGGNFNGFDMFVGVKGATSNPSNYQALYYQAGIDYDNSSNATGLDSYFGATNIFGGGNIIADERDNYPYAYNGSADYTYADVYTLNGDGSASDAFYNYWASSDGTIRVGYGPGPYLGLNVAFQSPSFSGSGVYIDPVGVLNAASSAPFTAFLSPGEFVTIYGSGLADTTTSASVPFPNNLGGVTVSVNEVQAPIYYVSPTQISFVVPFVTTQAVAQIQVTNNGKDSNVFTNFVGQTSVGAFTNTPVGGNGIAAAERPDYSVVSESNPAQVGETVAVYVAGMGPVSNQPMDGTAAPSSPLSNTTNSPSVYLTDSSGNSAQATVTFSGLAPGFAGLYQVNFTIPSGLSTANGPDTLLDIYSGLDSETAESILPITNTTSSAVPAARSASGTRHPRLRRQRRFKGSAHLRPRSANAVQP